MSIAKLLQNNMFHISSPKNKINFSLYILGPNSQSKKLKTLKKIVQNHSNILTEEETKIALNSKDVLLCFSRTIFLNLTKEQLSFKSESVYSQIRDYMGKVYNHLKNLNVNDVEIHFVEASEEIKNAAIVGLELASYNFLNVFKESKTTGVNVFCSLGSKQLESFTAQAKAVQIARHLVNLPPNYINPKSLCTLIKNDLNFSNQTKIEVWDQKKLEKENMQLLLAVGRGAETPPCMVHISYRPKKKASKKPIAFVGKGITFDTGGLDIKPSSAMRLMKKDMGGAAAVVALAYWVDKISYGRACDFYLALAENAVDGKSMRPSDVYQSRAGYYVEIDNTDAEGRLVLADVMDVAVKTTSPNKPEVLIDVATLTGAIKVALGSEIAGLFANDDRLAKQLVDSGKSAGELCWRMPLHQKYFSSMASNFADFKNSADGFGGAITAALFLEKFTSDVKWAHLDIYAWSDKPSGAILNAGGSGQPVQALIHWLQSQV